MKFIATDRFNIAAAVANEVVIAHPYGHTSFELSLLLGGGPVLFLAAQGWYLWAVPNVRSHLHVIGVVALLLVGLATLAVPPYVSLFLVGACLATLAVNGDLSYRKMDVCS